MRRKLVDEFPHATTAYPANAMIGNSDKVSGFRKVRRLLFEDRYQHPRHQQLPHNIKMVNHNHIKSDWTLFHSDFLGFGTAI